MRSDNNISAQAILKRFALIYLPIIMVLSVALLTGIQREEQIHVKEIEEREITWGGSAQVLATRDLAAVDTDLRIFAKLPVLRLYLDSGNPAQREELEKLFLVLAGEARRYDQVRYLDASGQEVIRINYNDGKPAIVPREQLQNKSGRYYFDDTFKLNQGEIFVSPLDLNIEHGSLEIPHKPMIRFGTPVFDSAGRKKGILLFNYLGDDLLQHFREAAYDPHDPSDNDMLLNRDGYWLSGTKREDEWGFMLGKKERTFGHDFPDEWRTISAAERGTLRTDQGLFVYTTVYPLLPKQRSATGSALANAPSQQEVAAHQYQWKIVSFVPHDALSSAAFYKQTGSRALLVFVYLLLALVAWIIASVTLSRKLAEKELRASEARLALTITSAKLATWDWNIKTGHDIFNERWAEMRGYRLEEIEPHVSSWEKDVNPDDLSAMSTTLEEHFKGRTPFFQAEYRVRTQSGSFIWILDRGTVFERDADGKPVRMAGIEIDITERKQTENDLLESKRELQEFFDLVPDMVCIASAADGCFRQVNKIWETTLGFTTDELIGKSFIDFIHPDDVAATLAEVANQLAGQPSRNFVNRYRNKDGSYKWLEWVATPAKENKLLYAAARDITERKQSAEALRISAQKHQLLFESSRDALMTLAPPSWKFTSANQATLQLFGASSVAEFTALGPWNVSPELQPDGRPSGEKAQEAIMTAMREGSHFFEWEHQRLDGQPFATNVLLTRMKVGEDVFLQSTVRDITERKKAEKDLKLQRDNFMRVLNAVTDGIYIVSRDYDIEYINPVIERDFGKVDGRKCYSYFHDRAESCPWCKNDEVFKGKTVRWEWHSDKTGKTYDLLDTPLANPDGTVSKFEIFHDITELKQTEDKIRRLNDELEQKVVVRTAALEHARLELEQASRSKDEFLAAISHELKTPLNHILGFADLLKEGMAGELNAEQKGMAQDIFAAGSKQLAIVNALIELARLQAGKMKLQAEPQDPAKLLADIAMRHAAQAQTVGLAFNVEVAQGLGEMPLDREVVTHLLDQLLENAFKFTPSGGKVSLTARRVPRSDVAVPVRIEAGEYLELAVADNGPGIAPEILPRLFQPFVQGDGRLARSYGGTGVGLMLVRLLAELHGGGSSVESEPGAGAKFLVWLPCGAVEDV